jgi:molybdenum cofactor biosynthesis enzyme MoaA
MGCLNANQGYKHWYSNIHLSGPCNRSCYFCIGQHMMGLDSENNLGTWPLDGVEEFVREVNQRGITEVKVTGTNTDPLLYRHTAELASYVREHVPNAELGVRTNGTLALQRPDIWKLYDHASLSIHSFDPNIYVAMMGNGLPPDVAGILDASQHMTDVKVNVVLGPENLNDVLDTLDHLAQVGVRKVNLREPYGQKHVGNPLRYCSEIKQVHGMPCYLWNDSTEVTYWNVHFVEVESVNLYASGRVSIDYPVTEGYSDNGVVKPQSEFPGGRVQAQWLGRKPA